MEIQIDEHSVTVRLTHDEAKRLGVAIDAGYESVSRAEYFIRTGLSQPGMSQIADVLTHTAGQAGTGLSMALDAGIETIENPRRPRPAR